MVNDQEPRYRLVDSNGNVVGSLFQNADGNVEIQDETGTGSVFGPDGIVTPAIDAESVSAGQVTSDDLANDTTHTIGTWPFAAAGADTRLLMQTTQQVGDTATTILDMGNASTSSVVVVKGRDSGASGTDFSDIVHAKRADSPTVIDEFTGSSATTRSYTRSVSELQLAMGNADGYSVTVTGLFGRVDP